MKQFVIIGLGAFGKRMVEELSLVNSEIMIIDKDQTLIDHYKDKVATCFVANALHEEVLRKLIPSTIDAAIVDLGGKIEVSVLITNYLKKLGIRTIVACAESDEHGEILELVGATQVIFPTREAAKRVTPLLASSDIFNYLPISDGLVIAEIRIPKELFGLTLIEADFRNKYNINIIAVRENEYEKFEFVSGNYLMKKDNIMLAAGKENDLIKISGIAPVIKKNKGYTSWLKLSLNFKRKTLLKK
ncbi:MAG: TrkA family potassium uptake protein [Spirochaetaceae bacterium]|jgi:trk system potassium uptake protein TrkA|nr:TrkA family potassium uptake protein [Spirochaetaceae bacterium]